MWQMLVSSFLASTTHILDGASCCMCVSPKCVATTVLDGTDAVMLSGETANGEHPTAAVTIMSYTCCEAESAQNTNMLYQAVRNSTLARYGTLSTSESIASSAVKTAIDVEAKALIVCSESGTTATQVAKFRPNCPIYVMTAEERVARQCYGLLRGSTAKLMSSMGEMENEISSMIESFKKSGTCKPGDAVVIVTGTIHREGATNLMRVQYA